jgi:hypothetical protein
MPAEFEDFEGRRFYWDGRTYASPEEAAEAADGYREGGFEVRLLEEAEGHLVYSRREARVSEP